VGGSRTIKVNVRLVATSNRDLMQHVERGSFRLDLYYRLNVFPVNVPPLRERSDDILLLAEHFLGRYARKHGSKPAGFADSAKAAMLAYNWPGNVRELQNTVERAVILSVNGRPLTSAALGLPLNLSGVRQAELFDDTDNARRPEATSAAEAAEPTDETVLRLDDVEKRTIHAALGQTGGNRTKAAELLGISIRTLRNKLQEYRGTDVELGVG
jgi:DNA-binding NtrC family response regulator